MCLIAVAFQPTPHIAYRVAANRDEAHSRSTEIANRWSDAPHVIAGRDLQAGGTWLGATDDGRFAAVTNYRERPASTGVRSRGELVAEFLVDRPEPETYAASIAGRGSDYGGFSLVVGTPNELWVVDNRSGAPPRQLAAGLYVLSNHLIDTPWSKSERLRVAMQKATDQPTQRWEQTLLLALADRSPADDSELPDTGLSRNVERTLSSPFIVGESYGTRCSSVLEIGAHRGRFVERSFDAAGAETTTVCHTLEATH